MSTTTTLTYGTLPERKAFAVAFERTCPEGYRVNLNARDADTFYNACEGLPARRFGDTPGTWTEEQTWKAIFALIDHRNERASDLACAILYTLGFEWV